MRSRLELRANIRDSNQERFALRFPFPPEFLPPGQTTGFMETVDGGRTAEVSLASLIFDLEYRSLFGARARIDAVDLYSRNPTSEDRKVDLEELWLRFGEMPERLELPGGTSLFLLMGKAPKMERQPVRLLESYGVTSTSFNRFNDVQFQLGGSFGRHLYWRSQYSSGNPLFFRDTNALAGDNGIRELLQPFPNPELKSGFPILYDAEVEDYFFETDNPELGFGLGYRWASDDGSRGFDVIVYDYRRDLAETVDLRGTFYGGDLDLLDGAFGISLPIEGNRKRETGMRVYAEWNRLTAIGQYVDQTVAGLDRDSFEVELGYDVQLQIGPRVRGGALISSVQPAVRYSRLTNHFRGPPTFVAPSVWWDWIKIDAGIRIGILDSLDVTIEYAHHDVDSPVKLELDETLVTLRLRL
ncbi:MAG TPA: hypothetical protein VMT00_05135 [Thermoanaerobaculia bacterium]|nr:hypothetical protein [Thermoanaerobaculia bacterium]